MGKCFFTEDVAIEAIKAIQAVASLSLIVDIHTAAIPFGRHKRKREWLPGLKRWLNTFKVTCHLLYQPDAN